jgi:predicted ATPase/class 3 adenylate cyclase
MGTVTLLFTDIEGSTRLLQRLGDEQYSGLLVECRSLLRTAFERYGGYEVDTQGDAFFVAFARAANALAAVIASQRALTSHLWPEGINVRVRMGLHTGEPQQSTEGYVGLDVHRAARIMSAGHGGQVLLSQTTRDLVEQNLPNEVSLQDLGAHRLKDLASPSHLFQLVISGLPAEFPPLKTLDAHPNNLPIQPTSLIGREKEVAIVRHLLQREDVRLLSLTGPGGTGKTRLGLQVAAELSDIFAHGVFFVNLASIGDPALVVPTIAKTLEVLEITDQSLYDLLKIYLRDKQLLLLLDNFEQVATAAVQVADLLAVCPKLKVLVTSRMVLHVQAEHEFAVPPLEVPDPKRLPGLGTLSQYEAVALFISRAQTVRPEFQINEANARVIAEICVRLDGLPLSIELAAARIKMLPPQALLARLGKRLSVLTSGAHDVPTRQQTLRNTIAWSYHLLDASEQRLFQRIAVFAGGSTLEAIESLCTALADGAGQVFDGMASLLDKSLLQQTEQEGEAPRFVMLETIREYGLESLTASGEMEATRAAHAQYYLALVEDAEPELAGSKQAVWLERLEQELDNLRAALGWLLERGEGGPRFEMALRLAGALRRFWEYRGHVREGWTFLERALARSKGVAAPVQVKALKAASHMAYVQGDNQRAEVFSEKCLARCLELGDRAGVAFSLRVLGLIASRRYNFEIAISLTEESLALFREVGDREGIAWSLNNLASFVSLQGAYARANSLTEESLGLFRAIGNIEGIISTLNGLAVLRMLSQGDQAAGHTLLEESLRLCREVGYKEGISVMLGLLGQVALLQGDVVKAHMLLEESVALYRGIGQQNMACQLIVLGRVVACQGDLAAARALYEESLAFDWEAKPSLLPPYLEGLADMVATQGDPASAARLWGLAEVQREAMGVPISPVERESYERSVTLARNQLGEKAFATAWALGRTLSPGQVLAAQRQVTRPSLTPREPSSTSTIAPPQTYLTD